MCSTIPTSLLDATNVRFEKSCWKLKGADMHSQSVPFQIWRQRWVQEMARRGWKALLPSKLETRTLLTGIPCDCPPDKFYGDRGTYYIEARRDGHVVHVACNATLHRFTPPIQYQGFVLVPTPVGPFPSVPPWRFRRLQWERSSKSMRSPSPTKK